MTHDFWVHLKDWIALEWKEAMGPDFDGRLPVTTTVPMLAWLPGFGVPQRVFLLALDQISQEQREAIIHRLSQKFSLSPDEAQEEVQKAGIPIREEHIEVVILHNPQRWID